MPVEQIARGLWRVGGGSWNGTVDALSAEGDANVYVLHEDSSAALIDCGTLEGRAQIEANVAETGAALTDLAELLLSHSHWDHSEAASHWQTSLGLRTHLNATGASFLANGDHRLVGDQTFGPGYGFEPFAVHHAIADGETFALAGVPMTTRFLPGHTPDSTLFTFERDGRRLGLCGDIAFGSKADGDTALGLLSLLWLSNLDAYVESLAKLAAMEIDVLIPGHGGVVNGRDNVRTAVESTVRMARRLAEDPAVRVNLGI